MDELTEIVKNSYNELKQAWTNNHKIHPTAHRRQLKRLGQEQPMLYAWMVRNFGPPRVEGENAPALETTVESGRWRCPRCTKEYDAEQPRINCCPTHNWEICASCMED